MTVSKTTTQEKARLLLSGYPESFVTEKEVHRYAEFADSISAELQKENARLREALEKIRNLEIGNSTHCYGIARAALSKEDSRG